MKKLKTAGVRDDVSLYPNGKLPKIPRVGVKGVSREVAEKVIARSNNACAQCDRVLGNMEISHTIAKGMGGTHGERSVYINSEENLHYLCDLCHRKLFHHENVIHYIGGIRYSCDTCYLKESCLEQARLRGIL